MGVCFKVRKLYWNFRCKTAHLNIQVSYFDLSEPISKDEVLLAVPAEMQLDSESAIKRWPELAKVIVGTDLDEHTTLVLACMIE